LATGNEREESEKEKRETIGEDMVPELFFSKYEIYSEKKNYCR
jgi:hypothetical protein